MSRHVRGGFCCERTPRRCHRHSCALVSLAQVVGLAQETTRGADGGRRRLVDSGVRCGYVGRFLAMVKMLVVVIGGVDGGENPCSSSSALGSRVWVTWGSLLWMVTAGCGEKIFIHNRLSLRGGFSPDRTGFPLLHPQKLWITPWMRDGSLADGWVVAVNQEGITSVSSTFPQCCPQVWMSAIPGFGDLRMFAGRQRPTPYPHGCPQILWTTMWVATCELPSGSWDCCTDR